MPCTSSDSITVFDPVLSEYSKRNSSIEVENNWMQPKHNASIEKKNENSNILITQYKNDIIGVILNDLFEDGTVTKSEEYIKDTLSPENCEYIKTAIMELYLSNLDNSHILTGLLTMISCIPYQDANPQCPIMALGLLQNKDISIRDKAVQVFEKWNSKAGIPILKSLKCDRKWLQRYVDRVILYLERDGLD